MVYKSIDHRKLPLICLYDKMGRYEQNSLALFSNEKAHALHLTSFLLSVTLIDNTVATSQSVCGNFDSYCKLLKGE